MKARTVTRGLGNKSTKTYKLQYWKDVKTYQEVILLDKLFRSQVEARLLKLGYLLENILYVVPEASPEARELEQTALAYHSMASADSISDADFSELQQLKDFSAVKA